MSEPIIALCRWWRRYHSCLCSSARCRFRIELCSSLPAARHLPPLSRQVALVPLMSNFSATPGPINRLPPRCVGEVASVGVAQHAKAGAPRSAMQIHFLRLSLHLAEQSCLVPIPRISHLSHFSVVPGPINRLSPRCVGEVTSVSAAAHVKAATPRSAMKFHGLRLAQHLAEQS